MGDPSSCRHWIEQRHDIGASPERANRKAAANNLAERGQVRRVAEALLRSARMHSKRDDLVGDEQNAVRTGQLAEARQELVQRVYKSRPVRQRIDNDRRQLIFA